MTGRTLNPYDGWSAIRKRARAAGFLTRLDVALGGQPASGSTWRTTDGASPLSGWPSVNNRLYDRTKDESANESPLENDLWLVLHLMIAGRLHWRPPQASLAGRNNFAAFDFPNGSLILTEAGTKRRASLHLLSGEEPLPFTRFEMPPVVARYSGKVQNYFNPRFLSQL
jgi:hypothetical protein